METVGNNNEKYVLSTLPYECMVDILKFLEYKDINAMYLVSTQMYTIACDNLLWRHKCLQHLRQRDKHCCLIRDVSKLVAGDWHKEYQWRHLKLRKIHTFFANSPVWCAQHINSSSGIKVVSGTDDGQMQLWDPQGTSQKLYSHPNGVNCICAGGNADPSTPFWQENSDHLFSGSQDASMVLWDLIANQKVRDVDGHAGSVVTCAEFGPHQYVTGSADTNVNVWDARLPPHSTKTHCLSAHSNTILSVKVLGQDSRYVLSSARDKTLILWDLRSAQLVNVLYVGKGWVRCMSYNTQGRTFVAGGDLRPTPLMLWKLDPSDFAVTGGKFLKNPKPLFGNVSSVCSVTGDSLKVITGSFDCHIKLWDRAYYGDCMKTFRVHSQPVTSVHLSNDSSSIVSASLDKFVKIWTLEHDDGKQISQKKPDQDAGKAEVKKLIEAEYSHWRLLG